MRPPTARSGHRNEAYPRAPAVALGAAVTKWQADTSALYEQLVGHSHGLRSGAAAYQVADDSGATAVDAAGDGIADPDLGL